MTTILKREGNIPETITDELKKIYITQWEKDWRDTQWKWNHQIKKMS